MESASDDEASICIASARVRDKPPRVNIKRSQIAIVRATNSRMARRNNP